MIRPNLILDLNNELIVDNFAGGGGASTGIERALGRHVDHAINHDRFALGMHRINHPQTVHHCEDVFDVDPAQLTEGRPVGMGWFSPDCKHFSKAKGGKPLSKKIRGLAFVILRWAKIRTRVIYMENVEEIQTWGPLLADGRPDAKHKGRTWKSFLAALGNGVEPNNPDIEEMLDVLGDSITREELIRGFGYEVQTRELRACDYGTPTIRKRLFLIARCDGRPIVWPEPTHAKPDAKRNDGQRRLAAWVPVSTCIDWDVPCHSIFLTPEQAKVVRCRRPLAKSTMRRIATGIDRYVLKSAKPFLVSLTHQGSDRVEGIDEPAKTLTGAHLGEKALVNPEIAPFINRAGHSDESPSGVKRRGKGNERADIPLGTQPASNEFARVDAKLAPFLTEHANSSNQRNVAADKPMPTQCAEVKGGHFALVGATVVSKHSKDKPTSVEVPIGAASARDSFALGSAFMVQKGHLKSNSKMIKGASEPMRTQVSRSEHGVVTGILVGTGGPSGSAKPKPLDKPHNSVLAANHANLCCAHLTKFTTGAVGQSPDKPLPTIAAGSHSPDTHGGAASVHGLVAASAVKLRGTNVGHPIDEPGHVQSAGGTHHRIVQSKLIAANEIAYYGNDKDGQPDDEPARTVTVRERFGHVQSEMVSPLTPEQIAGAKRVAAFLREHGVVFEGEFATLHVAGKDGQSGTDFVIVDIGMRMLTARELFRAQGFGNQYIIDRAWLVNPKTGEITEIWLTKEQQIRMCGNSVCPDVAEAIVRANSSDLAIWNLKERKRFQRGNKTRSTCHA